MSNEIREIFTKGDEQSGATKPNVAARKTTITQTLDYEQKKNATLFRIALEFHPIKEEGGDSVEKALRQQREAIMASPKHQIKRKQLIQIFLSKKETKTKALVSKK